MLFSCFTSFDNTRSNFFSVAFVFADVNTFLVFLADAAIFFLVDLKKLPILSPIFVIFLHITNVKYIYIKENHSNTVQEQLHQLHQEQNTAIFRNS